MKNSQVFLCVILVFLINVCVRAQSQSIQPGFKVGLNLANFQGEDSEGAKIKAGVLFGGVLHVPISEKFAIQPELLYVQQGSRGQEAGTRVKFNNNYLMLPVMAKYYFSPGIAVQAGPYLSALISSRLKGGTDDFRVSVDSDELYKPLDFGVNMGLSFEYSEHLVGVMQYSIGLANIADDPLSNGSIMNSAIHFSLAYRFVVNE